MMSNPFSLKALSKASFTRRSVFCWFSFTFPAKLLSWWRKTSAEGTLRSRRRVHFSLIIARNSSPMCFCYFRCVLGVYKITSSMKLKKKNWDWLEKFRWQCFDGSKTRTALSERMLLVVVGCGGNSAKILEGKSEQSYFIVFSMFAKLLGMKLKRFRNKGDYLQQILTRKTFSYWFLLPWGSRFFFSYTPNFQFEIQMLQKSFNKKSRSYKARIRDKIEIGWSHNSVFKSSWIFHGNPRAFSEFL